MTHWKPKLAIPIGMSLLVVCAAKTSSSLSSSNPIEFLTLQGFVTMVLGVRLLICFLVTFIDTQTYLKYDEEQPWELFKAFFANLLWTLMGGFEVGMWHLLHSLILIFSIVGSSWGRMRLSQVRFFMFPFGRVMVVRKRVKEEALCVFAARKSVWILVGWIPLGLVHLSFALAFCASIVAIPFGMEHLSMAQLMLSPFRYTEMREGSIRTPSMDAGDDIEDPSREKRVSFLNNAVSKDTPMEEIPK